MTVRGHFTSGLLPLIVLTAAVAALVSAVVVVVAMRTADAGVARASVTAPTLQDAAEAFQCKRGLTRIVEQRGVEDGFSRAGSEPSRIHPRLLRNGFFADLEEGATDSYRLRAYDERGVDGFIVDHFTMPRDIVSGRLIVRMRRDGTGADNDGLYIGDLDYLAHLGADRYRHSFYARSVWTSTNLIRLADGSVLWSADLAQIDNNAYSPTTRSTFLDFLNAPTRGQTFDLLIGDDTMVDALVLIACQKPQQAKGTTLSERQDYSVGPGISFLACSVDRSQRACSPFSGDRLCSVPGPIACYRDGNRAPPSVIERGTNSTAFVGGEVRLSKPERGDRFPNLRSADAFCREQFGPDWRVLNYHEGGGGSIVSYSKIAPGTRALVNIEDQQYGNCWDREVAR